MTVGTSYTAVGQALSAGSADIGFISGGNYVLFSDDCDVLLTALRYAINKDSDDPKDWNDGTIEENTDESLPTTVPSFSPDQVKKARLCWKK